MSRPTLVIAGASGVVGRHLIAAALPRFDVTVLTRHVTGPYPQGVKALAWRPDAARAGLEDQLSRLATSLEGAHALVNLAGSSIGDGRLGEGHRRRVIASRIDGTTTLVTALRRCRRPPACLVQASATGIYGHQGDDEVPENAPVAEGSPLGDICLAWEAAAAPAAARTRVCVARLGLVVADDADAFQRMLLPVRLGLGGPLGSGRQWTPWIDADDAARALLFLADRPDLDGVFNVTAPQPVRQRDLARLAARRLRRPYGFPVPAPLLRLALGKVADAAVLQTSRVVPSRLLAAGFTFDAPDVQSALEKVVPEHGEG